MRRFEASQYSMSKDPLANLAEHQQWTAPYEDSLQDAIKASFHSLGDPAGHTARNVLHGTWLHQPLHAIIVEVPIGSWTTAVVCDMIAALNGSERMNNAADAAVIVGLVGAMGAAATGLNDWADTKGAAKRIGAVHGVLNVAAVTLFGASWLARRKGGSRPVARALCAVGYLVVAASSHLGGNLVYEHGVGVQDTKPLE